jgi:hypothetical protein
LNGQSDWQIDRQVDRQTDIPVELDLPLIDNYCSFSVMMSEKGKEEEVQNSENFFAEKFYDVG